MGAHKASAEFPSFRHLGPRDGLANGTVGEIVQDNVGFMWFATPRGLNRYDAGVIRTYIHDHHDPSSLPSSNVISLFFDSRNRLWAGTDSGLALYDSVKDAFIRISLEEKGSRGWNIIKDIAEGKNGIIWIASQGGLVRLEQKGEGFSWARKSITNELGTSNGGISRVREDARGLIWTISPDGLEISDPNGIGQAFLKEVKKEMARFPLHLASNVYCDKAGNVWIGFFNGAFVGFNSGKARIDYEVKRKYVDGHFAHLYKMAMDRRGVLWVASNDGLISFDTTSKKSEIHLFDSKNHRTIRDNNVFCVFEDKQENLWIGTYSAGVSWSSRQSSPFVFMPFDFEGSHFNRLTGGETGSIFLISDRKGIFRPNKDTSAFVPMMSSIPGNTRLSAVCSERSGLIWIGGYDGMVYLIDPSRQKAEVKKSYRLPTSRRIMDLLEDSKDRLWIATADKGLFLLNKIDGTLTHDPAGFSKSVKTNLSARNLLEDKSGNIWAGVEQGVVVLKQGEENFKSCALLDNLAEYSPGFSTNCMSVDRKGNVWIGTFYAGMWRYDPERDGLVRCMEIDILADNNIGNILSDHKGRLWLSNDLGLVHFDPEKNLISQYYFSDGIPGAEIIARSSTITARGDIYFATKPEHSVSIRIMPVSIPWSRRWYLPA